ncbi:MAG: hypothetical protein QXG57_06045 [Thermofilaceae archaeon]
MVKRILFLSEVSWSVIALGGILLLALLAAYLLTNMSEDTFAQIFIAIISLIAGIVTGNELTRQRDAERQARQVVHTEGE